MMCAGTLLHAACPPWGASGRCHQSSEKAQVEKGSGTALSLRGAALLLCQHQRAELRRSRCSRAHLEVQPGGASSGQVWSWWHLDGRLQGGI